MNKQQTDPTIRNSLLKDVDGNWSSKRLAGMVIVVIGLLKHIIIFSVVVFYREEVPNVVYDTANTLLITGGSLLGVSTLERLKLK